MQMSANNSNGEMVQFCIGRIALSNHFQKRMSACEPYVTYLWAHTLGVTEQNQAHHVILTSFQQSIVSFLVSSAPTISYHLYSISCYQNSPFFSPVSVVLNPFTRLQVLEQNTATCMVNNIHYLNTIVYWVIVWKFSLGKQDIFQISKHKFPK